jgi:two-component system OmpR family sensor kinase
LLASEKKSFYRFLGIYLISTFFLFSSAVAIFYENAKKHIVNSEFKSLDIEAQHLKNSLRVLHQNFDDAIIYPRSRNYNSAIFNLDKELIFSTFKKTPKLKTAINSDMVYKVYLIKPYYLGAAYLLVGKKRDSSAIALLQKNIIIFMAIGGGLFFILGLFLGKLFIKPMKESIQEKNRFIQDATHELNTPISTILANIELIEALNLCDGAKEELKRIEIASKTLSRIYEDLTYINFNHKMYKNIENLNISKLLNERVIYFRYMIEAKRLTLITNIKEGVYIKIDKNDAIRLIDNLISNAIKYNRQRGVIEVGLDRSSFWVRDGGIGIRRKDIKKLFERFKRANSSEGGFGLGLSIVNAIVKEYNFHLKITSEVDIGTEVVVIWKKD